MTTRISYITSMQFSLLVFAVVLLEITRIALAGTVHVAVATNFRIPMDAIKTKFELIYPHQILVSTGSTGRIFTQIVHGSPYDVFLAADVKYTDKLIHLGMGDHEWHKAYAYGQLVLAYDLQLVDSKDLRAILQAVKLRHLVVPNPDLAPYGRAAQEVLDALNVTSGLRAKIVTVENVGQSYAMVASSNAQAGFSAASLHANNKPKKRLGIIPVPEYLYTPIQQNALLISRSKSNDAAREFFAFLSSKVAKDIISSYDYRLP